MPKLYCTHCIPIIYEPMLFITASISLAFHFNYLTHPFIVHKISYVIIFFCDGIFVLYIVINNASSNKFVINNFDNMHREIFIVKLANFFKFSKELFKKDLFDYLFLFSVINNCDWTKKCGVIFVYTPSSTGMLL